MTALTITEANVIWQSGPIKHGQIAGEAFAAGACVYQSATDLKWYKAQCDGTAAEAGAFNLGMALGAADVALSRVSIAVDGAVVAIGTGTAGLIYCPGTTAGSYIPSADLASTNKATIAGLCIGSSKLLLQRVYNAGAVIG